MFVLRSALVAVCREFCVSGVVNLLMVIVCWLLSGVRCVRLLVGVLSYLVLLVCCWCVFVCALCVAGRCRSSCVIRC